MDGDTQRKALEAATTGHSLAALSKMLGRNAAWLQQYLKRGTPRLLPEPDRRRLAAFLGVTDASLGGPPGPIAIPRLDLGVAAGAGRLADGEAALGEEPIAAETLRRLGARAEDCAIVRVEGDSMEPLLAHGDRIVVDRGRTRPDTRGAALWVVRIDGDLRVKRVRTRGDLFELVSENPAYPAETVPKNEAVVIGRVVRLIRDFG